MRQALIINYGLEGKAADRLSAAAEELGVWCRAIRDAKACLRALEKAERAVLVIRLGRHLEQELSLLQQTHRHFPEARPIALADSDNPMIATLAWELGAAFVLSRPLPWELLPDLVTGILKTDERTAGAP